MEGIVYLIYFEDAMPGDDRGGGGDKDDEE
jgi:hypothetical protein